MHDPREPHLATLKRILLSFATSEGLYTWAFSFIRLRRVS